MPTLFDSRTSKNISKPHASKNPQKKTLSRMMPLSAYSVRPEGVRFETQEAEETVELFLRQHPVVNIPWIALGALMIVAPTILFPFVLSVLKLPITIPLGYLIVGTAFWYLATSGFLLANFLHWFFNIYIVTNERIVDIDFLYLLYKHFGVAELSKIQDLSYTEGGILATVFDYGNVSIQTAGETQVLEFALVPHPEKVVEKIRELSERLGQP